MKVIAFDRAGRGNHLGPAGPKRQFNAFFGDEHSRDCAQAGPPVWQILIGRKAAQ